MNCCDHCGNTYETCKCKEPVVEIVKGAAKGFDQIKAATLTESAAQVFEDLFGPKEDWTPNQKAAAEFASKTQLERDGLRVLVENVKDCAVENVKALEQERDALKKGIDVVDQMHRKASTERDELREKLEEWRFHKEAWGTDPHEVRKHITAVTKERDELRTRLSEWESGVMRLPCEHDKTALDFADQTQRAIHERDELRAEIEHERDEARLRLEQSEILRDEIYEAAKSENERHIATAAERDELRAEIERLKAACEKEFASVLVLDRENMSLKADKARLDWLEAENPRRAYHYAGGFTAVDSLLVCHDGETIRQAIDAAMKGDA